MTNRIVSVTADQVEPSSVSWLWAGLIPLGTLSIVAGSPGWGKSTLALGLCARATRGQLPGALEGEPVSVAYVSAEDSLAHTLVPRLQAAGADLARCHLFEHVAKNGRHGDEQTPSIRIPDDLPLIASWIADTDARVLVLDPVVAMISGALNTHKDADTRRALAPLMHLADERQMAVLTVLHLNKSVEQDALSRISGSVGFGGAARSVLLFAGDPEDPEGENGSRRVLAHVKCNLGVRQRSLSYTIEPRTIDGSSGPIETSIVVRQGYAEQSANDLTGGPTSASAATARIEAEDFLRVELADGPVLSTELTRRADDLAISERTLKRAKNALKVRSRKTQTGWTCELPAETVKSANRSPSGPLGPLGLLGPLEEVKEAKSANSANSASRENVAPLSQDTLSLAEEERIEALAARHADLALGGEVAT